MRKDIVFENITQCTVIDTSDWWGACTRTTAVFNYIIKVSRKINSESIVKMSRALERDMEKGVFFSISIYDLSALEFTHPLSLCYNKASMNF